MSIDWLSHVPRERDESAEPAARASRRSTTAVPAGAQRDGAANGDGGPPRARSLVFRAPPTLGPGSAADQWVPLGPHVTLRGQATRHPRISGRCRAIAVSPEGQRVYAGTAQGGTWFSGDGGEHWLPLDFHATTRKLDGELGEANALAVGSVAVRFGAAGDGSQDVVYVGTGEQKFIKYAPLPLDMQGVGVRVATGPAPQVRAGGPTFDPWVLEATDLAGAAILRLVVDDQTGDVWAATTRGLFKRPAGGGSAWDKVDTGLDEEQITDVVVTRGDKGGPRRVYVASSEPRLVFRLAGQTGAFTEVSLPDVGLPKPVPVTMVVLTEGNVPDQAVVYVLADGPRLWRVHDAAAEIVEGLPSDVFGEQATYDMAIAVHPASQDTIAVGGSGTQRTPTDEFEAALYVGMVIKSGTGGWSFVGGSKPASGPPLSFVGTGVHADVHDLSWVPGPAGGPTQLWVACDGGVFRSTQDGKDGTFAQRNTGIGSVEAQYVAQHPDSDTILLVGTQDNGSIRALSPETWALATLGDAGGVAIDPLDPRRQLAQYLHTEWSRSLDGGATFSEVTLMSAAPTVLDTDRYKAAYDAEKEASSPYCNAAVIANGTTTQLAVGTDRVWLSLDWGSNWVTIPSGKNPYDPLGPGPDRTTDVLDDRGKIFVLKWASPDALHVLTRDGVYLYSRASAPGSPWTRARRYDRPQVQRDTKRKTPSGQIPASMELTDLASHDLHRGGLGSLYASTSGVGDEHVWWFDGQGHWLKTGLPVDSPVHALVVDPAHPEVVYAGTDVGVWKGVGAFPAPGAGDPTWTWTQYSNALPEAACIDLVFHEKARLLRAALRGRGVWEVALDGVQQQPTAYLRAHAFDSRRSPIPASGKGAQDPLSDPANPVPMRLDASPDVRVYRAVGSAPPPLPVKTYDAFDLWVIQSGLRALGKNIEATGVFDAATQSANAEVSPLPRTQAEWDARLAGPSSNRPAFDHDPPDAADVNVNLRDEPDRRSPPITSCATGAGGARVWVVVHGRDWRALAPDRVAVFVLRTAFNGHTDLAGLPALPVNWATSLRGDLTAATKGAWLNGTAWSYLDPATPFVRPQRAVDPREAQAVQFDVPAAAWPVGDWLLLAIVHADDDPLTATETDVATLVRQRRHAAARSVRRFAP